MLSTPGEYSGKTRRFNFRENRRSGLASGMRTSGPPRFGGFRKCTRSNFHGLLSGVFGYQCVKPCPKGIGDVDFRFPSPRLRPFFSLPASRTAVTALADSTSGQGVIHETPGFCYIYGLLSGVLSICAGGRMRPLAHDKGRMRPLAFSHIYLIL